MLQGTGVTKTFGGLVAVDHVDFEVHEEEIVGLIGPNGAGKTTLFNAITGAHPPDEGRIMFHGEDVTGAKPHKLAQQGIVRTFQTARTFEESSVLENVKVGAIFGNGESIDDADDTARRFLEFVGLEGREFDAVANLTLADRKLLEMARGLASDPQLILVDEIASGLTPAEIADLTDTIEEVRSRLGVTVFWIEHIMHAIMSATDRIIVLHQGAKIAEGTPEEVQEDSRVVEAYLGGEHA